MKICEKEECFGCFACVSVCPQTCITMEEDDAIGHIYPIIDNDRCIRCGLCQSVCPVLVKPEKRSLEKAYAAYSLDEKEHEVSSSGGVAACFSRNVISDGGVVYGCSSKMDNGISHIRVESADQLFLLQGSKYVHSHIKSTYIQAKEDLRMGKQVLFTGTPCQIAGLKSFLKKDYENLLTVDLVCHGVPSQRLLFDEIKDYDYSRNLVSFRELEGMFLKISSPESGNLVLRKTVYK
ncbi:MAG TPA: Coenzyme F420 hydrogenase/dehydrogenase, beta subunit C-terminal domain, partial [Oscillospiraceae bacterium]|nr:Coenzyme F420 hydrogenase/dehydrogenase, beta subunit C-terminal domain [Oscillospiraceae bacterium]